MTALTNTFFLILTVWNFNFSVSEKYDTDFSIRAVATLAAQPIVSTAPITAITTESAVSGGEVISDGGEDVSARGFVWGLIENPSLDGNMGFTSDGSGLGIFTGNITGLDPCENYHLRAYATNNQGTAYGSNQVFNTLPVPPVVVTNPVTEITHNSAVANALIINTCELPILTCGFVWSTLPVPDLNNNLGGCSGGSCNGEISCAVIDINPATTYYVRAYAITAGETVYGNIVSFVSRASIPVVATAPVNTITFYSAVSGGNIISDGGAEVTSRGVVWSMTPDPTLADHVGMTNDDSGIGAFSSIISDIQPQTLYYLRAYGVNSADVGYGNQIEFSTTDSPFSLCDALNNCDFVFSTGGNTRWFGQNIAYHDGTVAARSGNLTHGQESWLETQVEGPGKVSFWWKVSSEEYFDFLRFFINGEQKHIISGEKDWEMKQYMLDEGNNIIRWAYTKDDYLSSGADRAWINQLIYTLVDTGTSSLHSHYNNIQLYPNPFSQTITLKNAVDVDRLIFTNLLDEELLNVDVSGAEMKTIHAGALPQGVYLVKVRMKNGSVKIIKMIRE